GKALRNGGCGPDASRVYSCGPRREGVESSASQPGRAGASSAAVSAMEATSSCEGGIASAPAATIELPMARMSASPASASATIGAGAASPMLTIDGVACGGETVTMEEAVLAAARPKSGAAVASP